MRSTQPRAISRSHHSSSETLSGWTPVTSRPHAIMQHFNMKLLSTSDPTLIPSIKTLTPLRSGFPSSSQPSSLNKQPRTAFVHMPLPDTNKSYFEDPSDIEM